MAKKEYIANVKWEYQFDGTDRIAVEVLMKSAPGLKDMLENWYFSAYNEAVTELNKHYDEWNKEYDSLYGKIGDDDNKLNHYNAWIREKQAPILDKVTDDLMGYAFGARLISDEDCNITMEWCKMKTTDSRAIARIVLS